MAKKTEEKKDINAIIAELEKKHGLGRPTVGSLVITSTGSIQLDQAMKIGGTALGKIIEIFGEESCLSKDTHINFTTENNGKVGNRKGETIQRLYERFNKEPFTVKQGVHLMDLGADYYVLSKGANDALIRNKVLGVVKTGIKPLYEVLTSKGFRIKATAEHKFCTPLGYIPLSNLQVGDEVLVHSNRRVHVATFPTWRKDVVVKYHPTNRIKVIKDRLTGVLYPYKRIQLSWLHYEASLNNLSVGEWRKLLNTEGIDLSKYKFIPENLHIHHEDENYLNNEIDNLKLIYPASHGKLHIKDRLKNLSFIADEDIVVSIEPKGEEETFDIKCGYPFNNFVANNFIVHNSGKSTITLHQIAEYQKAFPNKKVALFDYEHSFDETYARAIGIDVDNLLFYQPDTQEAGYDMILDLISKDVLSCAVIDSQTAAVPKVILDGEMSDANIALQARNNSKFCLKVKGQLSIHSTSLFIVSQTRNTIGGMGDPNITTGGKAIKFYADARWKVWKMNDKEKEQNKTTVDVIKSKVGKPWGQAKFNIKWGVGISMEDEVLEYAVEFNIIKKAGSWYSYGETKLGQGAEGVVDILQDNFELLEEIKYKVMRALRQEQATEPSVKEQLEAALILDKKEEV